MAKKIAATKQLVQELSSPEWLQYLASVFPDEIEGFKRPTESVPSNLDFDCTFKQFIDVDPVWYEQINAVLWRTLSNDARLREWIEQLMDAINKQDWRVVTNVLKGYMTPEMLEKLQGIATGAEVNQNAYKIVKANTTDVTATNKTDTLTIVPGNNISVTGDAANRKITIGVTGIASGAEVNQNAYHNVLVGTTSIPAAGKTDTLTIAAGANVTITPDAANRKIIIAAAMYGHPDSGVGVGTYRSVTVNAQGHVTSGTNPTTLGGYGITDAAGAGHLHDDRYYTEGEVNNLLNGKANSSHGIHVPATQGANNAVFLRNDGNWAGVTPGNIGAALAGHGHTGAQIDAPRTDQSKDLTTARELRWRNFGNSHTIVDASAGNYPGGNQNAQNAWIPTYPTLVGYNGSQTYGVRVDSARFADSAGSAPANGGNADTVDGLHINGGRNTEGNKLVRTNGSGYIDVAYINSNIGVENGNLANLIYDNGDGYYRKCSIAHLINSIKAIGGLGGTAGESLQPNGWTKLSNGLILQWGAFTGQAVENRDIKITYPVTFTACYNAMVTQQTNTSGDNNKFATRVKTISAASFVCGTNSGNGYWIALGI